MCLCAIARELELEFLVDAEHFVGVRDEAGNAVFGGFIVEFDDVRAAGLLEEVFEFGFRVGAAFERDAVIGEHLANRFELRTRRGEHLEFAVDVEFFHPVTGIGEEAEFFRGLLENAEMLRVGHAAVFERAHRVFDVFAELDDEHLRVEIGEFGEVAEEAERTGVEDEVFGSVAEVEFVFENELNRVAFADERDFVVVGLMDGFELSLADIGLVIVFFFVVIAAFEGHFADADGGQVGDEFVGIDDVEFLTIEDFCDFFDVALDDADVLNGFEGFFERGGLGFVRREDRVFEFCVGDPCSRGGDECACGVAVSAADFEDAAGLCADRRILRDDVVHGFAVGAILEDGVRFGEHRREACAVAIEFERLVVNRDDFHVERLAADGLFPFFENVAVFVDFCADGLGDFGIGHGRDEIRGNAEAAVARFANGFCGKFDGLDGAVRPEFK